VAQPLGKLAQTPLAKGRKACNDTYINERQAMKFQVTAVEFDFEDATTGFEQEAFEEEQEVVQQTIGQIWEAEDEDDLVDEVTWATGWCVKSLEYVVLPDEEVKLKSGRSVFV
jgi:hypothetical protein